MTLKKIRQQVKRLDPKLDENSSTFQSAVLLLSAAVIGADELKLATFTGYKLEWIQEAGARLRKSGVWRGEQTPSDWFEKDGAISFWLDVLVAEGLMERAPGRVTR